MQAKRAPAGGGVGMAATGVVVAHAPATHRSMTIWIPVVGSVTNGEFDEAASGRMARSRRESRDPDWETVMTRSTDSPGSRAGSEKADDPAPSDARRTVPDWNVDSGLMRLATKVAIVPPTGERPMASTTAAKPAMARRRGPIVACTGMGKTRARRNISPMDGKDGIVRRMTGPDPA